MKGRVRMSMPEIVKYVEYIEDIGVMVYERDIEYYERHNLKFGLHSDPQYVDVNYPYKNKFDVKYGKKKHKIEFYTRFGSDREFSYSDDKFMQMFFDYNGKRYVSGTVFSTNTHINNAPHYVFLYYDRWNEEYVFAKCRIEMYRVYTKKIEDVLGESYHCPSVRKDDVDYNIYIQNMIHPNFDIFHLGPFYSEPSPLLEEMVIGQPDSTLLPEEERYKKYPSLKTKKQKARGTGENIQSDFDVPGLIFAWCLMIFFLIIACFFKHKILSWLCIIWLFAKYRREMIEDYKKNWWKRK